MSWAEELRANREAARQGRQRDLDDAAARTSKAKTDADARAEKKRRARVKVRADRAAARKKSRGEMAGWASAHMVEVLVYALAVVCAVMAVPAMAIFGWYLYGPPGLLLPAVSEAGAWAFAAAVMVSRRQHPDRPVRWLVIGIAVFAVTGGALNLAHGWSTHGPLAGVVMAVVSVSGIVAHQLAVAAPPRSRAERAQSRHDRQVARRVDRARKSAVRRAAVTLTADGTATLVYAPGLYAPRRRRLTPTVVAGLSVDPADEWDAALADLAAGTGPDGLVEPAGATLADPTPTDPSNESDQHEHDNQPDGESDSRSGGQSGAVAVLDPPPPADRPARRTIAGGRQINPQGRRKLTDDEARDAARRLVRKTRKRLTEPQLRQALGVGAATARKIRNEINTEVFGDPA